MQDHAAVKEFLESKVRLVDQLAQEQNLVEGYRVSMQIVSAIRFYKRYWGADYFALFPGLIAAQPTYQFIVTMLSQQLASQGMYEAAASVAATAAAFKVSGNVFSLLHAAAMREAGDLASSRNLANKLLDIHADDGDAISELAQCDVEELFVDNDYYDVLDCLHRQLKPKTYLEIGVAQGRSMALSRKGTVSIGVDPDTGARERIFYHSPENDPQLFRLTSDDFFLSCNIPELLGQATVDVAFLDGLHLFEQTLKDFINVEQYANPNTVVLIHDCLPVNALVAERKRQSGFWLGDVWKIIPCLKTIRPDLEIITLPVKPSGLAVIRNLDPSSCILERQFGAVVEHFYKMSLPDSWEEKCKLCCVTDQSLEQLLGFR